MSKSLPKIAAVGVAVLAFVACSADSKPAPGTSGNPVPSGSSSSSSTASESSSTGSRTLNVAAVDPAPNTSTFDTAGVESLPAGSVLITFTNLGSVPHDMHLVRIIDGNFSTYRAAVASNAASVADLAEEVAQSTTVEPGGSSTIGAELTPGTYALVSFLTAPDGKTFAQDGMIRDLTVTAA